MKRYDFLKKHDWTFPKSIFPIVCMSVLIIIGAYVIGAMLCSPFSTPARFNLHVWRIMIGAIGLLISNRIEYFVSIKKIEKMNYTEIKKMLNNMPRDFTALNEKYGAVSEIEFCYILALHHYCKQIVPKTGKIITIYCHDELLFEYEKRMYEKLFYKPAYAQNVALIPADWIFVMNRLLNATSLVPFSGVTKERVLAEIDPQILETASFPEAVYEKFWEDVFEKAHILDVILRNS